MFENISSSQHFIPEEFNEWLMHSARMYGDGYTRGLYVYPRGSSSNDGGIHGIDYKVLDQLDAFHRSGLGCVLTIPTPRTPVNLRPVYNRLPNMDSINWNSIPIRTLASMDLEYMYIRRPFYVSGPFIRFLNQAKMLTGLKIIYEIPTYPYDDEGWARLHLELKDKHFRKHLNRYVDLIAYMGDESGEHIFGCPATRLQNGVSLKRIKLKKCMEPLNEIHLVCAATFVKWHGIDRVLLGLSDYYKEDPERAVFLHLIGSGPALSEYEEIVRTHSLERYVLFHGQKNHEEMARIMEICSIGVESLGRHRSNSKISSSLKSREYLAQGLPFVYSTNIDLFEDDSPNYCLKVPADETNIDISSIVAFHDGLFAMGYRNVSERIRRENVQKIDMIYTMKPVFDFIMG